MKRILCLLAVFATVVISTLDLQAQKKVNYACCDKMPIIGLYASETDAASAPLTYVKAIKRAGGVPLVIPMPGSGPLIMVVRILPGNTYPMLLQIHFLWKRCIRSRCT